MWKKNAASRAKDTGMRSRIGFDRELSKNRGDLMNCRARGSARQPLFVYGTLRRASGHPMSRALAHNARQVGPGAIRGRMYYPGPYPAVIEDDRAGWISGEVVEVRGGAYLWSVLDIYEGCHDFHPIYERRRAAVLLSAGGRSAWISAWCYLMRPRTAVSA